MANCNPRLLGVMIVYCDSQGQRIEEWINLDAVAGLSWCSAEVKEKKGKQKKGTLPVSNQAPGECPKVDSDRAAAKDPICWWTGTEWVCDSDTTRSAAVGTTLLSDGAA